MKIYFAPAPTADYTKKKVWSRSFICVEVLEYLEPNKQYPTLVQYGDRKPHTDTSDECNRFP